MIRMDGILYQIRFRKKISPSFGMEDDKAIHSSRCLSELKKQLWHYLVGNMLPHIYCPSLIPTQAAATDSSGPITKPLFRACVVTPLTFIVTNRHSPVQIQRQLHLAAWAHTFFPEERGNAISWQSVLFGSPHKSPVPCITTSLTPSALPLLSDPPTSTLDCLIRLMANGWTSEVDRTEQKEWIGWGEGKKRMLGRAGMVSMCRLLSLDNGNLFFLYRVL